MPRAGSATVPGALKRYQACHRCRTRKLKCDGSHPCSNCKKAHEQALKFDPLNAAAELPCIYDSPDLKVLGPKARMASLEAEIEDLRELLRAANDKLAQCTCGAAGVPDSQAFTEVFSGPSPLPYEPGFQISLDTELALNFPTPSTPNSNQFLAAPPLIPEMTMNIPILPAGMVPQLEFPGSYELTFDIWPLNIPPPATLFHLVEIFFSSVPMASRLIHKPTFMSNLRQVPTSPDFPHVAVLHAICAMASLYSPIITQPQGKVPDGLRVPHLFGSAVVYWPTKTRRSSWYYFPRRMEDVLDPVPEGFGATHARWAAESMKPSVRIGDRALQLLQASIIIVWYHYSMGTVIPLYSWLGVMTRFPVPLGMNVAEGFEPLSRLPPEAMFMGRPSKTPIELESWRNIFWVSYVTERVCSAGIVWPLSMHDDEISQIMPCRYSDFISGNFVPSQDRQQIFSENMFLHHPALTTDSWTLYIKATILLSKVRFFNSRYRVQSHLRQSPAFMRPTQSEEFQTLDRIISAFVESIPRSLREPVGVTVDPLLYMAHMLPRVAKIQLHDPHAQLRSHDDYSSMQLLTAARDILDLVYKMCATSFDVLYLDHACGFCWFLAGTTLTRFLRVKIDEQDAEEVSAITQELATIKFMLGKLGERTLIGLRQLGLFEEVYNQIIRDRDRAASEVHGASTQAPQDLWGHFQVGEAEFGLRPSISIL